MDLLKERIAKEAVVRPGGVIIVTGFLNHRMDVELIDKIGQEFYRIFKDENPDVILTCEASGIGIACLAARYFGCNVVFAKKSKAKNLSSDVYTSQVRSFTKGTVVDFVVDKRFITPGQKVLIIDDFLADGQALTGLIDIVNQAGAKVVGAGICIEKAFQPGGKLIRSHGINLHSLAIVDTDENGNLVFEDRE